MIILMTRTSEGQKDLRNMMIEIEKIIDQLSTIKGIDMIVEVAHLMIKKDPIATRRDMMIENIVEEEEEEDIVVVVLLLVEAVVIAGIGEEEEGEVQAKVERIKILQDIKKKVKEEFKSKV